MSGLANSRSLLLPHRLGFLHQLAQLLLVDSDPQSRSGRYLGLAVDDVLLFSQDQDFSGSSGVSVGSILAAEYRCLFSCC